MQNHGTKNLIDGSTYISFDANSSSPTNYPERITKVVDSDKNEWLVYKVPQDCLVVFCGKDLYGSGGKSRNGTVTLSIRIKDTDTWIPISRWLEFMSGDDPTVGQISLPCKAGTEFRLGFKAAEGYNFIDYKAPSMYGESPSFSIMQLSKDSRVSIANMRVTYTISEFVLV